MTVILHKALSFAVVGAAMEIHRILGPCFLESVYQDVIEKELSLRGIPFQQQVDHPVYYKNTLVGIFKADLVIDRKIIVEIKGISRLNSSHEAQALHYLAATGLELAILINFGASSLEHRRVVMSGKRDATPWEYGGLLSVDHEISGRSPKTGVRAYARTPVFGDFLGMCLPFVKY